MKSCLKHFLIICLSCIQTVFLFAQDCPVATITINSQAELDSFPILYPDCNRIIMDLVIRDNDVHDLSPLSQIDSIEGTLFLSDLPDLNSLAGLENLKYIRQKLILIGLDAISSFEVFSQLEFMGSDLEISECPITNMKGFESLDELGGSLGIRDNTNLTSLEGFHNIHTIKNGLRLNDNNSLIDLKGLRALRHITKGITHLGNNDGLVDFTGLDTLETVGVIFTLQNHNNVTSLKGLGNLRSVSGLSFDINIGPSLRSLQGLDKLRLIDGQFWISNNDNLESFEGLNKLETITGELNFFNNPRLKHCLGLETLTTVGGALEISRNDSLETLRGLDNIDPDLLMGLEIWDCPMLDFCAAKSICKYLDMEGDALIELNETGCNNREEVLIACTTPTDDLDEPLDWSFYPNPSKDLLFTTDSKFFNATVIDIYGKIVLPAQRISHLDISNLTAGTYILKYAYKDKQGYSKFVKY